VEAAGGAHSAEDSFLFGQDWFDLLSSRVLLAGQPRQIDV
jgi:hypothetical protein